MLVDEKSKLTRAKQVLDDLIADTDKILAKRKSQLTQLLAKTSKTEKKIKDHFWKAIEYLLTEDKRLIRELNAHKDSQLSKLHEGIDSDHKDLQRYQGKLQLINQTLESDNIGDITDVDELCRSVNNVNAAIVEPTQLDDIQFVCDEEMLLTSIRKVKHELVTIPQEPSLVLSHVLNTRTSQDITDPDIRNVVVVDVNGTKITAVTDWTNRSVKSFYKEKKEEKQSVLFTGGWPFGITRVGDNLSVFVTDPFSKKIFKLAVYPELRILLTISTEKMYCGIASLDNSQLVVSGYEWSNSWASFWTIDILDTRGTVLKSIKDRVLQSPEYICTSSTGSIIASDKGTRSLIYLSSEGDEYLTVTPTGENLYRLPQGVTVARSGNIFLVDTVSNKVVEMTNSGEFIKDVLTSKDGLERPRSICVDTDGFVHISCGENIRVYELRSPKQL